MKKMYFLFKENGGLPTKIHEDYTETLLEAERIVKKTGDVVYVLETIGMVKPREDISIKFVEIKED